MILTPELQLADELGCSTMAVGFLLLTPAAILLVENVFGPLVAAILGLEPRLLQSQLGSNLWRTLGTTAGSSNNTLTATSTGPINGNPLDCAACRLVASVTG